MEALFLKILNLSIIAGWITLAILILRPLLKKAPRALSVALWALVAIRLLFPFSIESVISLIPSAETVPPEIVYMEEPAIESGITYVNTAVNPTISQSLAPTPEESVNPVQILVEIAAVVWIVGMIAMVIYATVSYLRIRLKVRTSIPLGERVRLCDTIPSPFILGILRPRIYLPSELDETQKAFVIAHEEAHLCRKDHWWKPLGFALLTVYWFHPLLWVAYILLCRDIEMACDEKVIRSMEAEEKAAYSKTLLACSMPRRMISACPLAFGEVGVKKRIKAILHYKKPAFWFAVVAVILCIACTGCLLTDPLKELEKEAKKEATLTAPEDGYIEGSILLYEKTSVTSPSKIIYNLRGYVIYHIENNQLKITNANQETLLESDMVPIELTPENLDNLVEMPKENTASTLQSLRNNNEAAWKVSSTDADGNPFVCYILKQTNQSDPIIVFFDNGFIKTVFELIPAYGGLSNAENIFQDFFYEKTSQIEHLFFNDGGSPDFGYNLIMYNDGTCQLSCERPITSSILGPFLRFNYIRIQEKILMFDDGIHIFTLTLNGDTFVYSSAPNAPTKLENNTGKMELPADGTEFYLRQYFEK